MINENTIRIIFGLKLRQLRREKKMSAKALATQAGLSTSYLNEIEKGKKHPKPDKIIALAHVLNVEYDELVSLKLGKSLEPISHLLKSDLLKDLPLDLFGISIENLVELMFNAPAKMSALISTFIELARNYQMQMGDFHFGTLRAYQEIHNNYFEDLEDEVVNFMMEYGWSLQPLVNLERLATLLSEKYNYHIDEQKIGEQDTLKGVRSIFVKKGKKNHLLLNNNINDAQKAFQLAKEIGYQYMQLKERTNFPTWLKTGSFRQVFNNFKVSYFAGALLIQQQAITKDLRSFFNKKTWNGNDFLDMMHRYMVSPETFMHRLTTVLARFFDLNQLFFLRFFHTKGSTNFQITKEMHLSKLHAPHANSVNHHYCRRWVSVTILHELAQQQENQLPDQAIVRVQRSVYLDTNEEYLCITIARATYPTHDINSSVTIGILVNEALKRKVKWWNDPQIPQLTVNDVCERCRLTDCVERAAPPTVLEEKKRRKFMADLADKLIREVE